MSKVNAGELKIVNIIGSGDLCVEIDLTQLAGDLIAAFSSYTPEQFPGLQIRFEEDLPLCNLFSSGKYTIVGAKSHDELYVAQNRLFEELARLDILPVDFSDDEFDVRNIVCTYDMEKELELNEVTLQLGLENVEYEPEQSPFVVYKPKDEGVTLTIPANGLITITGVTDKKHALTAVQGLLEELKISND